MKKGVIVESTHEPNEYISPIFLRPKKDGSHRLILNLKSLNQSVVYQHFKMDTIWTAIRMMRPGCYMASIDLKDAYYSVPINKDYQKYLKFQWRGKLYMYTCFPNGLAICPRKFTKLLKPVFSSLRSIGHPGSELSLKNHFAIFFGKILLSLLPQILDSANFFAFCPRNFYERGTAMEGRAYNNF